MWWQLHFYNSLAANTKVAQLHLCVTVYGLASEWLSVELSTSLNSLLSPDAYYFMLSSIGRL